MGNKSPYGSPAYLIGAGLSSLPQVMAQNEDMKTNAAMKKLQFEELQRQADTGKEMDKAMSDPMTMPQQSVTNFVEAPNPEYNQQQQVADQANSEQATKNQASVSQFGDEGQGQQAEEFSQKPTAEKTITKVETTQQPYDYSTMPHLRHAHEAQIVSERLRALGKGRAAQAVEEEGLRHQEAHKAQALSGMATAILGGQTEQARKWANSMGMNLSRIEQLEPGDTSELALYEVDSVQPDGSIKAGYASKRDLTSMMDPKLAIQSMNQMQLMQERYRGMKTVQETRNSGMMDRTNAVIQGKKDLLKDQIIKGGGGGVKGWIMKTIEDDLVSQGMPREQAHTEAIKSALVKQASDPSVTQKINSLVNARKNADEDTPKGKALIKKLDAAITQLSDELINGKPVSNPDPNVLAENAPIIRTPEEYKKHKARGGGVYRDGRDGKLKNTEGN